jgi:adenylate cyclase
MVRAALERALAGEQRLAAGQIDVLRVVGACGWFALAASFGLSKADPYWLPQVGPLGAYASFAVALWLVRRRVHAWPLAWAGPALLDPLAVGWAQLGVVHTSRFPPSVGYQTLAIALLIVSFALLTWDLAAFVAACASAVLLVDAVHQAAGTDLSGRGASVLVLLVAGLLGVFVLRRVRALAERIGTEWAQLVTMERHFPRSVALQVLESPRADSSRREVTVLAVEFHGLTAYSTTLHSEDALALLQRYRGEAAACAFRFGGSVERFTAEGLVIYFGAPFQQPDHANRAVCCALALAELRRTLPEGDRREDRRMGRLGVGVHTGSVAVGRVGQSPAADYAVVGDAVLVAARLEGLARQFDVPVLVSETTRARVTGAFAFNHCGESTVGDGERAISLFVPGAAWRAA